MDQLNTNPTPNSANTPDLSSQFPLLTAYLSAVDPIAHITTTISSQGDAFISKLTNFLNHADQTNRNYYSLQTLYQDSALELDSLRLVNSNLQAQLQITISQQDDATSQRDKLISTLSQANPIQPRSAEHPDPPLFSETTLLNSLTSLVA